MEFWLPLLKLLHLGGLILWLGPSGGAWLFLRVARRRLDPKGKEYLDLYRDFLPFFWVEHAGLLLLLGSGTAIVLTYDYPVFDWFWLGLKLALVLGVILPIEILDISFGHVLLPRWFRRREASGSEQKDSGAYKAYERKFVPLTLPLLLITVIVIMWLAVAKPM